jgi:hypothetical protein
MEKIDKELGNHKDLKGYLVNSRKIQEDIPSLKETWSEIENHIFEKRRRELNGNQTNRSVSLLYIQGVDLESRFLDDKYALLQEAMNN